MNVDQQKDINQNSNDKQEALTNAEDFKKYQKLPAINVRTSIDQQNNDLQQKKLSPPGRRIYASPYDYSNMSKVLKSLNSEQENYKKGGQINKQIKQQKHNMSLEEKLYNDELSISKKQTHEESQQNLAINKVSKIQEYFKIYNPKNANIGINQQQIVSKILQSSKLNTSKEQLSVSQNQQTFMPVKNQEIDEPRNIQDTQSIQIPQNSVISSSKYIQSKSESRDDKNLTENNEIHSQLKKQNPSVVYQKLRSLSQMNQKKSLKQIDDINCQYKNMEYQSIQRKKNSKHILGNLNNNTQNNTPIKNKNIETKISSTQSSNDYKVKEQKYQKIESTLPLIDPANKNDIQINSTVLQSGVQINKEENSRYNTNLYLKYNTKNNSNNQTKSNTPNSRYQSFIGDYQIENSLVKIKTNGITSKKINESRLPKDARKTIDTNQTNDTKSIIDIKLINNTKQLNDLKQDNNIKFSNEIGFSNCTKSQNQTFQNKCELDYGNFPKKKKSIGNIKSTQNDNDGRLNDIKKSLEKQIKQDENKNNIIKCNTEQSPDSIDNLLDYKVKKIIEKQKMKNSLDQSFSEKNEEIDKNDSFKLIKQHLTILNYNGAPNRSQYIRSSIQQRNEQKNSKQICSKISTSTCIEKNTDQSLSPKQQMLNKSTIENHGSNNIFQQSKHKYDNSFSLSNRGSIQIKENTSILKEIKLQQNENTQNVERKQSRPQSIIKYPKIHSQDQNLNCNSDQQPHTQALVDENKNEYLPTEGDILNQNNEQMNEKQQLAKLENKHIIIQTKVINSNRLYSEQNDKNINHNNEIRNENNQSLSSIQNLLKQRKYTNINIRDSQNRSASQNIKNLNISDIQIQNKKIMPLNENQKSSQDKKVIQKQGHDLKPQEDSYIQELKQFRRQKKFEQLMEYNSQQKFYELGRIINKINKSNNQILKKIKEKDFNQIKSVKFQLTDSQLNSD